MEAKIREELKKINKMTDSLTIRFNKIITKAEREKIHIDLTRLDGRYEAYMNVLKMIKEGVKWESVLCVGEHKKVEEFKIKTYKGHSKYNSYCNHCQTLYMKEYMRIYRERGK